VGNQGSKQAPAESRNGDRLESWGEIAAYSRCSVRTVQRWERDSGFPVHRRILKRGATVYAFRSDIDEWFRLRTQIKLAVLPFENMSGDPQQQYFTDGLTDEMITELGRLHPEQLYVIARASVMVYKRTNKTAAQIGKELGVDYILEGSVSRAPGRVRIRAQLIQVKAQTYLWTDSYDRNLDDVLTIQSDVAKAVAEEIRLKLTPQQQERLAKAREVNPDAYEAYLRGRHFWNRRYEQPFAVDTLSDDQQTTILPATAPGALVKSVHYFQDAIQKEPDFPLAYSGCGRCVQRVGSERLGRASSPGSTADGKASSDESPPT